MQNPTPRTPQYELVARIIKTKGLEGQLIAQELGDCSVLCPGMELWIVPPLLRGIRRTTVIEAQDDFKKHGVLITLEGVNDRTQASELAGRYLLASIEQVKAASQLLDPSFDSGSNAELLSSLSERATEMKGTVFFDASYGDLGVLDSIKPGPAYDLWVVEGPYGHLEIPAVDDYRVVDAYGEADAQGAVDACSTVDAYREADAHSTVDAHARESKNDVDTAVDALLKERGGDANTIHLALPQGFIEITGGSVEGAHDAH